MQNELWKPIPGYNRTYEASNLGRIRRLHKDVRVAPYRVLKPTFRKGYLSVNLCLFNHARRHSIHTLVAKTFLGAKPFSNSQINHKDANKINNVPDNLEWCTPQANIAHAKRLGLMPSGDRNGSHTHPERLARGNRHGSRLHPNIYQGIKNGSAKLDEPQVREIRQRYAQGNVFLKELAQEFNVSIGLICHVVNRRIWKHVT